MDVERTKVGGTPRARSVPLLSRHHSLFEWTAFILAIVAIMFAVIQFLHSKKLLGEMHDALGSMSTAYIGGFPDNMNEIIRVSSGAQKHLDIMTDFVGYGSYSDPEKFNEYMTGLQRVTGKGVQVRIIVYTRAYGEHVLTDEFPLSDFQKEKEESRYRRYFNDYHKNLGLPTDYKKFIGALNQAEEEDVKNFKRAGAVEIRTIGNKLPFYVWIQDDREAIISFFQTTGGKLSSPASSLRSPTFRTRDGKLIAMFTKILEDAWDRETVERPNKPSPPGP